MTFFVPYKTRHSGSYALHVPESFIVLNCKYIERFMVYRFISNKHKERSIEKRRVLYLLFMM